MSFGHRWCRTCGDRMVLGEYCIATLQPDRSWVWTTDWRWRCATNTLDCHDEVVAAP